MSVSHELDFLRHTPHKTTTLYFCEVVRHFTLRVVPLMKVMTALVVSATYETRTSTGCHFLNCICDFVQSNRLEKSRLNRFTPVRNNYRPYLPPSSHPSTVEYYQSASALIASINCPFETFLHMKSLHGDVSSDHQRLCDKLTSRHPSRLCVWSKTKMTEFTTRIHH